MARYNHLLDGVAASQHNWIRADGGNVVYIPEGGPERGVYLQNFITPAQLDDYIRNFIDIDWQVERCGHTVRERCRAVRCCFGEARRTNRYAWP